MADASVDAVIRRIPGEAYPTANRRPRRAEGTTLTEHTDWCQKSVPHAVLRPAVRVKKYRFLTLNTVVWRQKGGLVWSPCSNSVCPFGDRLWRFKTGRRKEGPDAPPLCESAFGQIKTDVDGVKPLPGREKSMAGHDRAVANWNPTDNRRKGAVC